MWYLYRNPGWAECQTAVAFPLHLHPALALRLSLTFPMPILWGLSMHGNGIISVGVDDVEYILKSSP